MRYWVPLIEPGREAKPRGLFGALRPPAPPAPQPAERLGGVPFGLPAGRWPACADCGRPQSLLAQFAHHPERLDLGRDGRMLLVFQCGHDPGMCETWDQSSGANACLILEPEEIGTADTPLPHDPPPLDPAVFVTGWVDGDDGLNAAQAEALRSDATIDTLDAEILENLPTSTHLGGVPCWIQSADEAPAGWRFIGQLDGLYSFFDPAPPLPSWVHADPKPSGGRTHWAEGANFGDSGIAYLFASDREGAAPEVRMFWQCC